MRRTCDRVLLAAVLVVVALTGVSRRDLWLYDEPREAEIAREMAASGDFTVATLNGRPFLEKPPLFSATIAVLWRIGGEPSLLVARLVALAYASLAVVALHRFARRALSPAAAWVASGTLVTTYRFDDTAHLLLLDNAVVGGATVAILALHVAGRERRVGCSALAGAALATTVLAKGLVGVALVAVAAASDLLARRDRGALRFVLHPWLLVTFALPVAGWIATIDPARRAEWLHELFVANQWGRFHDGYQSRPSEWWSYLPWMAGGLLPWTPLVVGAIGVAVARTWRSSRAADAARLALAWTVPNLVLLTLSRARAGVYSLPLVPGAALLVAAWWQEMAERRNLAPIVRRTILAGGAVLAATSVVVGVGAVLLGRDVVACASLVVALASAAAAWRFRADFERVMFASIGFAAAIAIASRGAWFLERQHRRFAVDPCGRTVASFVGDRPLLVYEPNDSWSGVFAFCSGRMAREVTSWGDLEERARREPNVVLVATPACIERLPRCHRGRIAVDFTCACENQQFVVFHLSDRRRSRS